MPKCFLTHTHTHTDASGATEGSASFPWILQDADWRRWGSMTLSTSWATACVTKMWILTFRCFFLIYMLCLLILVNRLHSTDFVKWTYIYVYTGFASIYMTLTSLYLYYSQSSPYKYFIELWCYICHNFSCPLCQISLEFFLMSVTLSCINKGDMKITLPKNKFCFVIEMFFLTQNDSESFVRDLFDRL